MARIKYEFFPESRIRLSREVPHHSDLLEKIAKLKQDEFEIILAQIATYCDVALDGTYTQEDLNKLCDVLYKKLIEKRTGILVLN